MNFANLKIINLIKMSNKTLKAFVRLDGQNRVIASSLILRKNKPKVGRWREIVVNECCTTP